MGNNKLSAPKWAELIKQKRTELGETQTEFGSRFGVTMVAVSLWESGKRDVPSRATWWLTHEGAISE